MTVAQDGPAVPRGQLIRSVSWLTLSVSVSKISTLLALIVLGRYLGEEYFGRFAIALAVPAALEAVADLGISWALIREGAHRRSELNELVIGALIPKLLLACVMVGATAVLASTLGLRAELFEAAVYLAVARALDSMTYLARAVFQATEKMQYDAASYALDGAVRLLLILYGVASGFGVIGFAKALVIASLITMSGTWLFTMHRFLRRPERVVLPVSLLAAGLPLTVVWFLDSSVIRIGIVLVGTQLGDAPAGGLAAALRIIEPVLSIPALLAAALLPLATRHIIEQRATLPWLLPASLRVGVLLAGAATIVLSGLASTFVTAVFGPQFELAGPLLRLLALALVPLFMRTILIAFLLAMRAQRQLILSQTIGLILNVALTVWLLPTFGAMAAVAGLVVGEWVSILTAALVVPRLRDLELRRAFVVLPPLAVALVVLALTGALGEIVSTSLALGTFLLVVRASNVIDERDLAYTEDSVPLIGRVGRLLTQR